MIINTMRITLTELRQIIREAMITELEPGMYIRLEHSGNTLKIMIMKQGVPRAPASIRLRKRPVADGSIWEVMFSSAQRGWGPLLYDIAMEYVSYDIGDLGIMPDSDEVSDDARGVWAHYFNSRGDVENDPLPKSMLYQAGDRPEYLKHYYYKISRSLLDKFEAQGLIEHSGDFSRNATNRLSTDEVLSLTGWTEDEIWGASKKKPTPISRS